MIVKGRGQSGRYHREPHVDSVRSDESVALVLLGSSVSSRNHQELPDPASTFLAVWLVIHIMVLRVVRSSH
jgi:hypothetical protein